METEKTGLREFRENPAGYLEAGKPLAITRHGETLGFSIPAPTKSRKFGEGTRCHDCSLGLL